MEFDNPKVYGDISITDGLVLLSTHRSLRLNLHIFTHLFTHFCLGKPRSDKNRNAPRQLKSSIFISLLKKLVPSLDSGYESEIGVGRDGVILL